MTDADLEAKFRGLTTGVLGTAETGRLIELCRRLRDLTDTAEIARAAVPGALVPAV
jgi:hypothetical protein